MAVAAVAAAAAAVLDADADAVAVAAKAVLEMREAFQHIWLLLWIFVQLPALRKVEHYVLVLQTPEHSVLVLRTCGGLPLLHGNPSPRKMNT